jgi:type II secretory pathway pseudopilin PulG
MAQQYMKWMLVSRTSNKGFTILEMIVGIAMTLTVSALALAALSNAESGFTKDKNKIEGGQKLSSVLDIVGRDIVQAGEQINEPKFPVIKVVDDGSRGSKIVIYRALEEALSTCNALPASTAATSITVVMDQINFTSNTSCNASTVTTPTATSYPIHPSNVTAWNSKNPATATPVKFYLHNGDGYILPINLTGITAPNTQISLKKVDLTTASFTPAAGFDFPIKSTAYLVEKTQYLICDNTLIARVNNDDETNTPGTTCTKTGDRTIANNITRMDIKLSTAAEELTNPTLFPRAASTSPVVTALNWRDLRGVTVTIAATNPDANNPSSIVASGRFYPRNILSTNAQ